MTPFEAVYGLPPPRLLTYVLGTTLVEVVDKVLRNHEQILAILQQNMQHAQQRMEKYADLKRSERKLNWVSKYTFTCSLIGSPMWLLTPPSSFRPIFRGPFPSSAR
jgi:hypothetical protein